MGSPVVVLAGGSGGAKLARGLQDEVGGELVVIANTGDDVEIHGGHVSPDPDLVTFWLADRVDERGWGLRDDTFKVMEALRALGEEVWFNLGDQDLARQVLRSDDVVDALYHQIVQDMLGQMQTAGHKADVDLANIMIAKNLERIGDHCTNIAEDVIFVRLGRIVRHLHAVL